MEVGSTADRDSKFTEFTEFTRADGGFSLVRWTWGTLGTFETARSRLPLQETRLLFSLDSRPMTVSASRTKSPIDICINNAIQFPSGGNTYAPTEGKCRSARGPSPAGAGPVGHGLVAERSGAPHPVRSQFRPALAAGAAPRGTRRFAGALLARTPAQVGG